MIFIHFKLFNKWAEVNIKRISSAILSFANKKLELTRNCLIFEWTLLYFAVIFRNYVAIVVFHSIERYSFN